MSRKPRVYTSTGIYHIILRGNNKQNLFNDDDDRSFFLKRLNKYAVEFGIEIYTYCLMNNHVHILVGNAGKNISRLILKLATSYAYRFNRKYDRCGHLFQDRFKSEPVTDEEYFKTVYRYILQNCEKAGLGTYSKYKWNSYHLIGKKDSAMKSFSERYVIEIFGSISHLRDFLKLSNTDKCMEFENKIFFTDQRAFTFIKQLLGITSPYTIERLDIDQQMQKCRILKENGLSISQISRITGISKAIIRAS